MASYRNRAADLTSTAAVPRRDRSSKQGPVILLWICRVIVGALFVFSGFVKINDVKGFAYKLEKYWIAFSDSFGFDFTWLNPATMSIAATVSVVETILGFFILFGLGRRSTPTLIFLMIIFFTFLTGYGAFTGKITDCGCFGDFMKTDPMQSFIKDLILMVFTGILFWFRGHIRPVFRNIAMNTFLSALFIFGTAGFTIYATVYEGFDFRACAVGNSFKEVTTWDASTGEAALSDYQSIADQCGGKSEFEGAALLVFMKDMTHLETTEMEEIAALGKTLDGKVSVFGLTTTPKDKREAIAKHFGITFCISEQDEIPIKTCIRSSPGFVLLKNGIVKEKWTAASLPSAEEVLEALNH